MKFRSLVLSGGLILIVSQALAQPTQTPAEARPATQARVSQADRERGRYIVERVAMCFECHSTRDAQGTIVPGTRFMGGPLPVRSSWPNDWATRAPRIAGLPGYTDEQALRVLTQGAIGRSGQLRLPMPRFRMTEADAVAVMAYLRAI